MMAQNSSALPERPQQRYCWTDIDPGSPSSDPTAFDLFAAGSALFIANDGTHGNEFYLDQGAGTASSSGSGRDGQPRQLQKSIFDRCHGRHHAYFVATDNTATNLGTELYITNGTAAGTVMVKDINPGSGSSDPANFVNASSFAAKDLVFTANDGTDGTEEWITAGTAATTVRLDPGAVGSPLYKNPTQFTINAAGRPTPFSSRPTPRRPISAPNSTSPTAPPPPQSS